MKKLKSAFSKLFQHRFYRFFVQGRTGLRVSDNDANQHAIKLWFGPNGQLKRFDPFKPDSWSAGGRWEIKEGLLVLYEEDYTFHFVASGNGFAIGECSQGTKRFPITYGLTLMR